MSQSSSGLQYDELGFLIGLKQTGRDVAKIDKNVEQIISLLEQMLNNKGLKYQYAPQPQLSVLAQALKDAQRQPISIESLMKEQYQATTAMNQMLETVEDLVVQATRPTDRKTLSPNRFDQPFFFIKS